MKLFHATDRKNIPGIKRVGLLTGMSTGKRAAVWAVKRDKIVTAILHCCRKRAVPLFDVVVLEITVPDSWVKRFAVSGMVWIARDVPPERVRVYGDVSLSEGE